VALTFDDGPNPPYTEKILEILNQHQAHGTFFLKGKNIELHRNSALKIIETGHEVGNHTYSHSHLAQLSIEGVKEEILRTDGLISGLGYRKDILFRAPFGQVSPNVMFSLMSLGKLHIGWDVQAYPPRNTTDRIQD